MRTIEISHRTIIFTILFLVGLWFLWQVRQVLLTVFIAFLFATALNPIIGKLTSFRIPRWIAIFLTYILVFGVIFGTGAAVVPPLVDQTAAFASKIPQYLTFFGITGGDQFILSEQIANLGKIPENVFKFALSAFSNLVAVFGVLVLTFYMLLEWGRLDTRLAFLFGHNNIKAHDFLAKAESRLGGWVRGEVILMVIIGILSYIGLRLLGIHFALPLALLAGLLEVVPSVGPLVSAIPAVIVGFTISPVMGISVGALYFLIQQLENSLIAPKIMQKSIGIPPIITLIVLGVGVEIGGITGAILALPIFLVVQIFITEFFPRSKLG